MMYRIFELQMEAEASSRSGGSAETTAGKTRMTWVGESWQSRTKAKALRSEASNKKSGR